MSLKIIHTADWHLGQLFHDYDRTYEHKAFLNWLIRTSVEKDIDVLLVSGDVFDVSNPSAATTSLFYNFIKDLIAAMPRLQVIFTAGNHDSAGRLEAPKELLASFNIHICGLVTRNAKQEIDYSRMIIPLYNKQGKREALCMAIPFLRQSDHPAMTGTETPYADGVCRLYAEAYALAAQMRMPGEAIIALGHLHALKAETSTDDKSERNIMGGVECIPYTAFDEGIAYTALGHIHKAQRVGGRDNIRYCGSPLPMSFSEINYRHRVLYFETEDEIALNITEIDIPVTVPLQRVPLRHGSPETVLEALHKLPEKDKNDLHAPYLEVRVMLHEPDHTLRFRIHDILKDKHVRLTRIDLNKPLISEDNVSPTAELTLAEPCVMLEKLYRERYNNILPDNLRNMFNSIVAEAETTPE